MYLAKLRKRQEQNRQHCFGFVKKWRVSPSALGVGLLLRYDLRVSIRNPSLWGYILGKYRKLTHAEIQAPHFKKQIQCLQNIWFKKSAKKQQTNKSTL